MAKANVSAGDRLVEGQTYIRTCFCKNLHAKCYLNEELCIITSSNLYEFGQVNNNEMGILIRRSEDAQLYKEAYEEAQRFVRISDEIRVSLERVSPKESSKADAGAARDRSADVRAEGLDCYRALNSALCRFGLGRGSPTDSSISIAGSGRRR